MDSARCASLHFGPWLIEPQWFVSAVEAVRLGVYPLARAQTEEPKAGEAPPDAKPYGVAGGVAVINVNGPTMKVRSKFGGTSSVDVRRALRMAVADDSVSAIVLHMDTPGGTVAGTHALAADVAAANAVKPVYAHGEDTLASAGYWTASQARGVTASPTTWVGSLGVMQVLTDSSKAAEKNGFRVIPITTGKYKAAGMPGTEITDDQLAYFQSLADKTAEHFKAGVVAGRGMPRDRVDALFDGRVHDAADALAFGLIDEVLPFDALLARIQRDHPPRVSQINQIPAPAFSGPGAVRTYPAAARSLSYASHR